MSIAMQVVKELHRLITQLNKMLTLLRETREILLHMHEHALYKYMCTKILTCQKSHYY